MKHKTINPLLEGNKVSLVSKIKLMFHRSEPSAEEIEDQAVQEETTEKRYYLMFNRGMPIEVMKDFDTALLSGRLGEFNAAYLTVVRIPGEISFPICEVGSDVLVRGYDDKVNPIILWAKVIRSSAVECVLGELMENSFDSQRKDTRYPVSVSANIYAMKDTWLNHPQPCRLMNISTGGACIVSEYAYETGETLRLRVELIKNGGHTSYHCRVVRMTGQEEGRFVYGLLFAQLDKRKIESLARDIQDIQRDTEQKMMS